MNLPSEDHREMKTHAAFSVALVMLAAPFAAPATRANGSEIHPGAAPIATAETTADSLVGHSPWTIRVETSLMGMRDSWLRIPSPELGLTVARDVARRLSVEVTGSVREIDSNSRRSWSAVAAARWAPLATADGRHALTIAGGPLLEIDNAVHGTIPFAHAELAYVYRAPFGLTVLAGVGPNVALASSSYVTPPSRCQPTSDSFCIDLGPDAQELHAGDVILGARLALGWRF
jgi:hypothetical protein